MRLDVTQTARMLGAVLQQSNQSDAVRTCSTRSDSLNLTYSFGGTFLTRKEPPTPTHTTAKALSDNNTTGTFLSR